MKNSQPLNDAQLLVRQYSRRFGHSPPMLLGLALPVVEMQQALRSGNPVRGWEKQEIALAEQLAANDQPGNKQPFVSRCGNVQHVATSSGSASIGFSENLLKAMTDGVQGAQESAVKDLAHAMGHHGDHFVNEEGKIDFYSHHSPLFAIQDQGQGIRVAVGELMKELVTSSPEAVQWLGYPLYWWSRHSSQITALQLTQLIQRESYAQLYAMYYGNRDLMQREYPIAYELFKEIHEKVSVIGPTQSKVEGRAAVSAAVQQALRALSFRAPIEPAIRGVMKPLHSDVCGVSDRSLFTSFLRLSQVPGQRQAGRPVERQLSWPAYCLTRKCYSTVVVACLVFQQRLSRRDAQDLSSNPMSLLFGGASRPRPSSIDARMRCDADGRFAVMVDAKAGEQIACRPF